MIVDVDDTKQCPFVEQYGGSSHDVLANMRCLDDRIETHPQYCPPVNLFAPKGTQKVLGEGVNSSPGVSALRSLH